LQLESCEHLRPFLYVVKFPDFEVHFFADRNEYLTAGQVLDIFHSCAMDCEPAEDSVQLGHVQENDAALGQAQGEALLVFAGIRHSRYQR
jgi:hypothetical protein